MKVYVLGAGVSKTVGYPLGSELLDDIDQFVWKYGPHFDRFDLWDWCVLCQWLKENENPLIAEAYRTKQLEHLFTVLDHASMLKQDLIVDAVRHRSQDSNSAWANFERFDKTIEDYKQSRRTLLQALEAYLRCKHKGDGANFDDPEWNHLKVFCDKLCPGDVVLTFNYDSTLERVLLHQDKWSPLNGYGCDLLFQNSAVDETPKGFKRSEIEILHLHGAVGWYPRPLIRPDSNLPKHGRVVPDEARTPASLDTPISLDPEFLRDLGINAVDACLPTLPSSTSQILLHPSFFKDFELEESGGQPTPFTDLWKKAAESLRNAEQIFIIGYSLPSADSAALTLLLTNCDRKKVRIVNPDQRTRHRLRRLLSSNLRQYKSFEDWLEEGSDCPK